MKDFNTWQADRNTGKFDLVIDNNYQISDNPWTYWNGIYHLPILTTGTGQQNFNFERYSNPTAWTLVQKLDKTPPYQHGGDQVDQHAAADDPHAASCRSSRSGTTALGAVHVQVLDELAGRARHGSTRPSMWRGYLQMTGIDMITHLKHAK